MSRFCPVEKKIARQQLGWNDKDAYILFAGTREVEVKNYPLALQAVQNIPETQLIELKGFGRDEVNLALNAADAALMTSFTEGSPQFIKEAMACNCPVVSTDVGDVKQLTEGVEGCYITSFEVESVTSGLQEALRFALGKGRTEGRKKIEQSGLTDDRIAGELIRIYQRCVHASRIHDLSMLCAPLINSNVVIYADEQAYGSLKGFYPERLLKEASEAEYGTEFLDYKMAIKTVGTFTEALDHIARYGSKHSEAIVSENKLRIATFQQQVDAACLTILNT